MFCCGRFLCSSMLFARLTFLDFWNLIDDEFALSNQPINQSAHQPAYLPTHQPNPTETTGNQAKPTYLSQTNAKPIQANPSTRNQATSSQVQGRIVECEVDLRKTALVPQSTVYFSSSAEGGNNINTAPLGLWLMKWFDLLLCLGVLGDFTLSEASPTQKQRSKKVPTLLRCQLAMLASKPPHYLKASICMCKLFQTHWLALGIQLPFKKEVWVSFRGLKAFLEDLGRKIIGSFGWKSLLLGTIRPRCQSTLFEFAAGDRL